MKYVATLRALFQAQDDATAVFIADKIRENGAVDLEEDEGDSLDVSQVTSSGLDLTPDETIVVLKKARNLLIKTRIKQCYNLAKDLDKVIHSLLVKENPEIVYGTYSHGDFMDLCEKILMLGEDPEL